MIEKVQLRRFQVLSLHDILVPLKRNSVNSPLYTGRERYCLVLTGISSTVGILHEILYMINEHRVVYISVSVLLWYVTHNVSPLHSTAPDEQRPLFK